MDHTDRLEPDVAALERNLEKLLRERRPAPLLPGSQLAKLVNDALGGNHSFRDYFAANEVPRLRTFVERYVPARLVQYTGEKRGADNMFSIPAEASAVELARDGSLWKSFVAVRPTSTMVYNKATGSVALLSPGLPIPDECVVVAPLTVEEHRSLMKAFCAHLEEDGYAAESLCALTDGQDESLYKNWLAALRTRKPLDRTWGQFRRDKVLDLFEQRLLAAGAAKERTEQLRHELQADHDVARAPKVVAAASLAANVAAGVVLNATEHREKRARELLKVAAEKLTYDQLLAIQLPLGVLLDITGAASAKE